MKSTRRDFLRHSVCAALGAGAMSGAIADLQRVLAGTTASGGGSRQMTDYKALVCIFLGGGNDSSNMLIPRGTGYGEYARQRTILAVPQENLLPIAPNTGDGREYGFHPSLTGLQNLFNTGKLAVLANVGALAVPTTRAQFLSGSVPLPPSLFGHLEQTTHWQTSLVDQPPNTGWAGRTADLMHSLNGDTPVSMNISIAGTNVFGTGSQVTPSFVSTAGTISLGWYDDNPGTSDPNTVAINQIMSLAENGSNLYEKEFARIKRRAIDNNRALHTALDSAPPITTVFPNTYLGQQLKMVARLISARNGLGFRRQTFFCELNGFDTHFEQVVSHANSLAEVSQAMTAFFNATAELGVASDVTTFTASDFGRTYSRSTAGSEHGWGGHHLIMGGAVRGKDIYGQVPILTIDGPDDSGAGRWIPTTSVDQYSATLARWFGVGESTLPVILPNIGRFANSNLGFMNA